MLPTIDQLTRMYSMDDLLQLAYSQGVDELKLHVGVPPVLVVGGKRANRSDKEALHYRLEGYPEQHLVAGPSLTTENAEQLLLSIANTRQRRELRERGVVQFIYRRSFSKRNRATTNFLVCARMEEQQVGIDIQRQAP